MNCRYCYLFPGLEFTQLLEIVGTCVFKDEIIADFSKQLTFWKSVLEPVTGKVVISEVDALTSVVLSKAEKHVPHGQINWYNKMYNSIAEVSRKLSSL